MKIIRTIPCRYFDYGNGRCPFGIACLYAHMDREGNIKEKLPMSTVAARNTRVVENEQGEQRILGAVHLGDFLAL